MKLFLDSHILLAMALKRLPAVSTAAARLLDRDGVRAWANVASLWEIAIKARLGKLDPGIPVSDLPEYFEAVGLTILPITAEHAVMTVEPLPPTRDPFDRMLPAQCEIEGLSLLTLDRALRTHRLAMHLS